MEPWEQSWEFEKALGQGGQGDTSLVRSKNGDVRAVLKTLRNDSTKARGRMFAEVGNLRLLHSLNCKVPRVLDTNVELFEDPTIKLYFVMELIDGISLETLVDRDSGLELDKAIAICSDMCGTVELAMDNKVLHRDIKPENIMVRDGNLADVVFLDYGLSFNESDGLNLTETAETMTNSFLALPERRVPGADKRNPRSDITGLVGVLFYCITGHPPVELIDSNGHAPHQRHDKVIKAKVSDSAQYRALTVLFNKGFLPRLNERFASVQELQESIRRVVSPGGMRPAGDIMALLGEMSADFRREDQNTRKKIFGKPANRLSGAIIERVHTLHQQATKIEHCPVEFHAIENPKKLAKEEGITLRHLLILAILKEKSLDKFGAVYAFQIEGDQVCVYRLSVIQRAGGEFVPQGEWSMIDSANGYAEDADATVVVQDSEAALFEAVEKLRAIASSS